MVSWVRFDAKVKKKKKEEKNPQQLTIGTIISFPCIRYNLLLLTQRVWEAGGCNISYSQADVSIYG